MRERKPASMAQAMFFLIVLLCFGSLLSTVIWYLINDESPMGAYKPPRQTKRPPVPSTLCKGCKELIDSVLKRHSKNWKKNETNYRAFTSRLSRSCRGYERAIITQANMPIGTKILYDGEKNILQVTPNIFETFVKEHPFANRSFDTCAVVGNGGILMDSGCGKTIDSAHNNTGLSLRVAYTMDDFDSTTQAIFFNPEYLLNLSRFWESNGLKPRRLSTGIMMASMALEVCSNVHLYGFWPYSNHPHGLYTLTNHYYDDKKYDAQFHAMPVEFEMLLKLHSQGVLKLHLGDCPTDKKP